MKQNFTFRMSSAHLWISLVLMTLLITACTTELPESCPSELKIGLDTADELASNNSLPFQFPLEESSIDNRPYFGWFGVSNECPPDMEDCYEFPEVKYHAAEDYKRPSGTPVYSMADGKISFSGPAGGYGWLIIIDHPQANIYSLYGHLSPSRWKLKKGTEVERGALIGYLGDDNENGGSKEQPLDPHLHFGIRAGQTADYPSKGEWRYMAGWITLCPQEVGWLQPSLVITTQEIPEGGYPQPQVKFLTRRGLDIVVSSSYAICSSVFIFSTRKKKWFLLLLPGCFTIIVGIIFRRSVLMNSYILLGVGIVTLVIGLYFFIRQSGQKTK